MSDLFDLNRWQVPLRDASPLSPAAIRAAIDLAAIGRELDACEAEVRAHEDFPLRLLEDPSLEHAFQEKRDEFTTLNEELKKFFAQAAVVRVHFDDHPLLGLVKPSKAFVDRPTPSWSRRKRRLTRAERRAETRR